MTPTRYLASLGGARQLYVWLYEDAVGMLPPPDADEAPRPLESRTSLNDVAAALGWSQSVVRKELARLVNFGWVRSRRLPRYLGQREGAELHLLADLAAEKETGVQGVVSRIVVRVEQPDDPARREPVRTDGRGPARKWDPEDMDGEW